MRKQQMTTDTSVFIMNKKRFSFFTGTVFFAILFFVSFNVAFAKVVVYDSVTTTGRAVKLKATTKGRFFPEGGKLVEFYLDGRHIGTTLSGGDGYAFLKYLPLSKGVKHLKVKAGDDTDEGILLVTKKKDMVLLIEIENSLFVPTLRDLLKPVNPVRKSEGKALSNGVKGSKETLYQFSRRFNVIYLTTLIGVEKSKKWLKNNEFPPSAVLKWGGADMLAELQKQGLKLYAIIGSPAVLSEASDIKKRFSFEETEEGVEVKDWADLSKRLR